MFDRSSRLQALFLEELSKLVGELKDPGMSGLVTLTGLELSPDRKTAKVFFSVLGSSLDKEGTARALDRSSGYLHGALLRRLDVKVVPRLRFLFDETPRRAHRIENLLSRIRSQDDPAEPGPAETDGIEALGSRARSRPRKRPRSPRR
jgi:ribosome-binding factor A